MALWKPPCKHGRKTSRKERNWIRKNQFFDWLRNYCFALNLVLFHTKNKNKSRKIKNFEISIEILKLNKNKLFVISFFISLNFFIFEYWIENFAGSKEKFVKLNIFARNHIKLFIIIWFVYFVWRTVKCPLIVIMLLLWFSIGF